MSNFSVVSRTVLALDLLGLAGCVVLAVVSAIDTSSSTSAIGIAVALALAVPLLVSLVLTALGIRLHRSNGVVGTALVTIAAVITVGLFGLLALQLSFGS